MVGRGSFTMVCAVMSGRRFNFRWETSFFQDMLLGSTLRRCTLCSTTDEGFLALGTALLSWSTFRGIGASRADIKSSLFHSAIACPPETNAFDHSSCFFYRAVDRLALTECRIAHSTPTNAQRGRPRERRRVKSVL